MLMMAERVGFNKGVLAGRNTLNTDGTDPSYDTVI